MLPLSVPVPSTCAFVFPRWFLGVRADPGEKPKSERLILGDPDGVGLPVVIGDDVGGDDDEEFVVLGGEGIAHHGLIEAGDDAQPWDAGHRPNIAAGNLSRNHGGFAIPQADAPLIFLVGNYGHAVRALTCQRADLQFEFQTDIGIPVDYSSGLKIQSQIFIADRRKRRNITLIAENLRNLRRIEDGRVGSVQDGITLAYVKSGFFALPGAQCSTAHRARPRFVDGKSGAKLIEA